MSQTHLPTENHLFSKKCSHSNINHGVPNMLCMFIALITDTVHVNLEKKMHSSKLCFFQFLPAILILIWTYTLLLHQVKKFVSFITPDKVLTLIILEASSSRTNDINLQLPINLSWILLHTFLAFLLIMPVNSTFILTLKLMYFSLLSAMTPVSSFLVSFPITLINRWVP